jgi:uncharacterized repeat protein (TIGR03987 family)
MLGAALVSLALVFYSVGVWAERLAGRLRGWHLACFGLGLAADTAGTGTMFALPRVDLTSLHSLTGMFAIALMGVHAAWAAVVLARGREHELVRFHRFSLAVWCAWLVPWVNGAVSHL